MKGINRIILGIKLNEAKISIESFKKLDFLKDAQIDIVHISQMPDLSTLAELSLPAYQNPELKLVIEHAVVLKLKEMAKEFSAAGFRGKIDCHCFLSESPHKRFCQYADETRAQLMVLIPEKTNVGFGSFIHHQFIHSSVPLFILRDF